MPATSRVGPGDRQARALAQPTTHRVLRAVSGAAGPVTVAALAEYCGIHHNTVRMHLGTLRDAGLVLEEREAGGRRGRPRLLYRAAPGTSEVVDAGHCPLAAGAGPDVWCPFRADAATAARPPGAILP